MWPGDQLIIHVKNNAPGSLVFEADQTIDFNQQPGEENTRNPHSTKTRNLYFSEVLQDPNNPLGPTNFYLTEGICSSGICTGATPTFFSPNNPPALVTTQGSVEDWTIQNTATEDHAFHIHNLHFLVVAVDGVPLPEDQQSYQDVVLLPFWDGVSAYHNVTVRLDFRGADVGDLLYKCTFLTHADFGMRAFIRVLPNPSNAQ